MKASFLRKNRLFLRLGVLLVFLAVSVSAHDEHWDTSGSGSGLYHHPNLTLSCAAASLQGQVQLPHPPILIKVLTVLLIIFYTMAAAFSILLNSFVLYLVSRFKSLHTLESSLVLQLVVRNIISSALLVPPRVASAIANQWLLGLPLCITLGVVSIAFNLIRSLLMTVFVTDRFCNVFFPYSYPKHRVRVHVFGVIMTYVIAALLSVIPAGIDCYAFSVTSWSCSLNQNCDSACDIIINAMGFGVFIVLGSIVPVILYLCLFCKAKKLKAFPTSENVNSEVSNLKAKRERRATITFFMMFLALFLTIVPAGMVNLIVTAVAGMPEDSLWVYIVDSVTFNSLLILLILDPIFLLRNRDFREAINKVSWVPKIFKTTDT